ncbi:unnamed protein product [Effrenium voratum]|nr:unnamed protein product [Effrenium voratum]
MKQALLGLWLLGAEAAKLRKEDEADASCASFQCSLEQGWVPKPDHYSLKGDTPEECCKPTCRRFTCGSGYKSHPDYFDNVASSNLECCDRLCSGVACNATSAVPASKRNVTGATAEECCEPLCSQHRCVGSWAMDPLKNRQAGNSDEECCMPSCAALVCDLSKGYQYVLDRHDRAQPQTSPMDFCCEKTCAFYQDKCGEGKGVDTADKIKMATTATDTDFRGKCCEPRCSGVTCPAGHRHDPTYSSYLVSKVPAGSGCCQPTCKSFKCSAGWANNPDVDDFVSTSLTNSDCCSPTCAQHVCGKGWYNSTDAAKLSKVGSSDALCCEPSCKGFTCPAGLGLVPSAAEISGPSEAKCCESLLCQEFRTERTEVEHCNGVDEEKCDVTYDVHAVNQTSAQRSNFTAAPCKWSADLKLCRMDDDFALTNCDPL